MQSQNLKVFFGLKVVFIALTIALYQGWISLGDKSLFAESDKAKTEDLNQKNSAEDSATESKITDKDTKSTEDNKRKSFLQDIFELPKLDPKTARKEEVGKYLDMADRKDRQLKSREEMLAKREKKLEELEASIEKKLQKLDEERKFIAKTLQQEKDLKGERVEKLITLFDKMEPKKAAPQIEKLDKDLVVALFKGLKQKQVTTILEFMNPDKSVELTEYFGRVKSGREYDLLKELNESMKKEFADCKGMPSDQAEGRADATTKSESSPVATPDDKQLAKKTE